MQKNKRNDGMHKFFSTQNRNVPPSSSGLVISTLNSVPLVPSKLDPLPSLSSSPQMMVLSSNSNSRTSSGTPSPSPSPQASLSSLKLPLGSSKISIFNPTEFDFLHEQLKKKDEEIMNLQNELKMKDQEQEKLKQQLKQQQDYNLALFYEKNGLSSQLQNLWEENQKLLNNQNAVGINTKVSKKSAIIKEDNSRKEHSKAIVSSNPTYYDGSSILDETFTMAPYNPLSLFNQRMGLPSSNSFPSPHSPLFSRGHTPNHPPKFSSITPASTTSSTSTSSK